MLIFFLLAFTIHLIVWKIKIPRKQTTAILKIFYGILIVGLVSLWFNYGNIFLILHIFIIYSALLAAYIITYTAIEVDSPSLVMILTISNAGDKGLKKDKLFTSLTDELLVIPRLRDLLRDNLAYLEYNKYKLTSNGQTFIKIFIFYRRLLKLPKGG